MTIVSQIAERDDGSTFAVPLLIGDSDAAAVSAS
jgi:hypothetical protein